MSLKPEQITAALQKLGPSRPGEVADHLGIEPYQLAYQLKKMLDAGTVKATGSATARRIALPDQKFDETPAPPQPRATKPKKHRKAKRARKATTKRTPSAARPADAAPAPRFIPTVDSERRLHIINGAAPISFDDVQTEAIADLLLQHYAP